MPVGSRQFRRLRPACRISACTLSWDICRDNHHIDVDRLGSEPGDTPDVSEALDRRIVPVDHTRVRVSEVALDSPPDMKDMAAGHTGRPRGSSLGMIGLARRIGSPAAFSATSESLVGSEAARSDSAVPEVAPMSQPGRDTRVWSSGSLCHQDELPHSESVAGSVELFAQDLRISAAAWDAGAYNSLQFVPRPRDRAPGSLLDSER